MVRMLAVAVILPLFIISCTNSKPEVEALSIVPVLFDGQQSKSLTLTSASAAFSVSGTCDTQIKKLEVSFDQSSWVNIASTFPGADSDCSDGTMSFSVSNASAHFTQLSSGSQSLWFKGITDLGETKKSWITVNVSTVVDTLAPFISVETYSPGTSVNTNSVTINLTFSEAISGLDSGDFSFNAGTTASAPSVAVSGSGASYTVEVSYSAAPANAILMVKLAANSVQDAAGNVGPSSDRNFTSIVIDRTPPTVSTADFSGLILSDNTASQMSINITDSDFTTFQYKMGAAGSTDCAVATGYSSDITVGVGNELSSVSLPPAGSIRFCAIAKDYLGNESAAFDHTWTRLVPAVSLSLSTLTLSSSTVSQNSTVTATLTVKDQSGNTWGSGGHSVSIFKDTGSSTFTISAVTDNGDGTYTATIEGETVGSTATITAMIGGSYITSTLPTLAVNQVLSKSNSAITVSNGSVLEGASVTATLQLRDVNNGTWPSGGHTVVFTQTGGTGVVSFGSVTDNSNGTYSVTVTGVTAGTATSITATVDGVSTTTTLPTLTVNPLPVATVSSVTTSHANGTYAPLDIVDIQVTFSEAVFVTGGPRLQLETGANDEYAIYFSGSGTSVLVFRYTVKSGNQTPDLEAKSTSSLELDGGTIKNASNTNANLTLPTLGGVNSLGGTKAIVVVPLEVSALYAGSENWNDYVKYTVVANGPYGQSGVPCDGSETGPLSNYSNCIHAGEKKKVVVNSHVSCGALRAEDDLNVFNWVCRESGGYANLYSVGLKPGKGLRDLLFNNSGTPQFRTNFVRVYDGAVLLWSSQPAVWWTNPIETLTNSTVFDTASTIYVAIANQDLGGENLNADKIAVVTIDSSLLRYDGGTGNTCNASTTGEAGTQARCLLNAGTQKYLWIEADLDGRPSVGDRAHFALFGYAIKYSRFHNMKIQNTDYIATYLGGGLVLNSSSYNLITEVSSHNNYCAGFRLSSGSIYNTVSRLVVSNTHASCTEGIKIELSSTYNDFTQVLSNSNYYSGIGSYTSFNTLAFVTSALNGGTSNVYGIKLQAANNSFLHNILTAGNLSYGMAAASMSNLKVSDYFNTGSTGPVSLTTVSSGQFTGRLTTDGGSCYVSGGTSPGLTNSPVTCTNAGSSNAVLDNTANALSANNMFLEYPPDDSVNTHASNSQSSTTLYDWINFLYPWRTWVKDYDFPNASMLSMCNSGPCRIMDWSFNMGTTSVAYKANGEFVDAANCPSSVDGSETITDLRSRTWLRNAIEIIRDDVGNDNGLCEAEEHCMMAPNIGFYQGHGAVGMCNYNENGGLTGIRIYGHAVNGF